MVVVATWLSMDLAERQTVKLSTTKREEEEEESGVSDSRRPKAEKGGAGGRTRLRDSCFESDDFLVNVESPQQSTGAGLARMVEAKVGGGKVCSEEQARRASSGRSRRRRESERAKVSQHGLLEQQKVLVTKRNVPIE